MDDMALKQQQRSDHDLLVTLNVKVDNLSTDMREMKDGMSVRMGKLEAKVDSIEASHAGIDPKGEVTRIDKVEQWQHDFDTRSKIIALVISTFGGLIAFLLKTAVDYFL